MKNEDAELIERFLDGDESAFTELVKKHQKAVHALAWRKVGDFQAAEEITQDAFVKVYNKLSTLKNPNQFAGWLYVITNRLCIEWHRERRVPMQSLEAMAPEEIEAHYYSEHLTEERQSAAAARRREAIKQILQRLPESERTVVTLHYLGEMSCEEVGQSLGVSANTVKSRLHRARKRLREEADALREALGDFQLPVTFTGDILRKVARVTPPVPSGGKPLMPWVVSLSTAVLLILIAGFGAQHLLRFQQPYSFEANSEMTVELVDAPVTLALEAKPAVRTQLGSAAEPDKSGGAGSQADALLAAVADADEEPIANATPQWHQTNGPSGGAVTTLFVAPGNELYAVGKGGLFKLAADRDTWTFVNSDLPIDNFSPPMAARGDALYIACESELFSSTDGGETWDVVAPRPLDRRAIALLITDYAFYLALAEGGMFRSTDEGKTWIPFNEGLAQPLQVRHPLTDTAILSAAVVENTVFAGTSQGLYRLRLDGEVWEKLPVAGTRTISSIAVVENSIYFCADKQDGEPSSLLFVSTDFGDSWDEITPELRQRMTPLTVGGVKLVGVGKTVLGLGAGMIGSTDSGDTWTYLGFHRGAFTLPMFPAVALDEKTFFLAGPMGVRRSTDGGRTWHKLMNGMVQTRVTDLAQVNNVLYAATGDGIVQSKNGGERWMEVDIAGLPSRSESKIAYPKMVTAAGTLYVKGHHLTEGYLLELVSDGNVLVPVEGIPPFGEEYREWLRKNAEIFSKTGLDDKAVNELMGRTRRAFQKNARAGAFAVSGETFYLEDEQRKLFRRRLGESEWHDTGLEDARALSLDDYDGFRLAAAGDVVYVGKDDGHLFQSRDSGDTWRDITANLPAFGSIQKIVFAGSTVFVATNAGVVTSSDSENWHLITDAVEVPIVMHELAVDGSRVYGAAAAAVYRLKRETLTWEEAASALPVGVTSLVVDGDVLYVGTEARGVLRLQRVNRYKEIDR